MQRSYCKLAATQSADVMARRERHSTVASSPELCPPAVQIRLNGKQIEFIYKGPENNIPAWARPVLQSLAERWGGYDGWDSYDAKPTNLDLAVKLLNILSGVMEESFITPLTTPLADGGIQAEWHDRGKDLEIVVSADGNPAYYYFDSATNEEQEGDLNTNYAQVRDLIGRVSEQ